METIKVYKLFRQLPDGLHPLFIDRDIVLPMGEWLEAKAPDMHEAILPSDGYYCVNMLTNNVAMYLYKKPTQHEVIAATLTGKRWIQVIINKRGKRHYHDIGIGSDGQVLRFAHRPGWHSSATPSLPAVDMTGKVWAECLIPADDYCIVHRNVSGLSRTHEPIDWYISKKIFIVRLVEGQQINHATSATQGT